MELSEIAKIILSFIAAFVISYAVTPHVIKLAHRLGP